MPARAVAAVDLLGYTDTLREHGPAAADARCERLRLLARQAAAPFCGVCAAETADTVAYLFRDVRAATRFAYYVLGVVSGKACVGWGEVHAGAAGWHGEELTLALEAAENEGHDPHGCGPGEVRLTPSAQAQMKSPAG